MDASLSQLLFVLLTFGDLFFRRKVNIPHSHSLREKTKTFKPVKIVFKTRPCLQNIIIYQVIFIILFIFCKL